MIAVFNYKTNTGTLAITKADGVQYPKELDIQQDEFELVKQCRDSYGWKKGNAEGEEVVFMKPGKSLAFLFDLKDLKAAQKAL